jgi:mttA/Hcf106 family
MEIETTRGAGTQQRWERIGHFVLLGNLTQTQKRCGDGESFRCRNGAVAKRAQYVRRIISTVHLLAILGIALLIFGPKKIPELVKESEKVFAASNQR